MKAATLSKKVVTMLEQKNWKLTIKLKLVSIRLNWYLVLLTTITIILNNADKSKSTGQSATLSKLTHKQFVFN
jgi:hypothetical protein